MRKHLVHRLAGMGIGGERRYLGIWMPRQQAYRIGAGVPGRAENADLLLRAHHIAPSGAALAFGSLALAALASDLCWFNLKLPSTSSTDITSPTIAFFIASSRPAVIFEDVQGSFGASQLS